MAKQKVMKAYTLPDWLLKAFEKLPINRSAAISMAVLNAHEDPSKLVKALERRVSADSNLNEEGLSASRSNSTLNEEIIDMLDSLSKKTQLPVEHVLRLSMEAYVLKL